MVETTSDEEPNDRGPITGFDGSVLTSLSGENTIFCPIE